MNTFPATIPAKAYKSRVRCQCFFDGRILESKWIIEVCVKRKWLPLGDDNGIAKYDSKRIAEAKREDVVAKLVAR